MSDSLKDIKKQLWLLFEQSLGQLSIKARQVIIKQLSGLVQPPASNAARRFLWTALILKVRHLVGEARSYSFIFFVPFSSCPSQFSTSLLCNDLIPAVSFSSLSLSSPPLLPAALRPMQPELSLDVNSRCRPCIVISLCRTAGETVLPNLTNILPYCSPFLFSSYIRVKQAIKGAIV